MTQRTRKHQRSLSLECLEAKLPLSVSQGEDGWTNIAPSSDTRIVYVSSSLGDDANDGLTPETAKKTIAAGKSLLRDNSPDWLLLKRGDVWINEPFKQWTTSGRSAQEPQLISSYGEGPRPRLLTDGSVLWSAQLSDVDVSYFAVIGLHLESAEGSEPSHAISWHESGENLLFEDLYIESFAVGLNIQNQEDDEGTRDVKVRRSIVVDVYSATTFSHGAFFFGLSDVVVEENLFDHNGWRGSRDDTASTLNHNIYVQNVGNDNFTVRGNILSRASATGIQLRPGGVLEDNLFVENPISAIVGYPFDDPWSTHPDGVDSIVRNNVILQGTDTNSTTPRGIAIQLSDVRSNTTVGNIIANEISSPTNTRGIQINGNSEDPSRDINLRDNVFYEWDQGGPTGQDNQYVTINSEENNFYYDFSPITGNNVDAALVDWTDPNRSAETYNASLGGAATFDAFVAEARKQSRDNWRLEYTAEAVNEYIRYGFQAANGGNRAPVAFSDVASIDVRNGETVSGSVLSNDSDPDSDALAIQWVEGTADNVGAETPGEYGILFLRSDGSYDYTLDFSNPTVIALKTGDTLTETFTYTTSDSNLSTSSILTITAHGVDNSGPLAFGDRNSVVEDSEVNLVTGNVLTNDFDPDGDKMTIVSVSAQATNVGSDVSGDYGTLLLNVDGTYAYTLDNANSAVDALDDGETLVDSFQYTVSDGKEFNSTSLNITINGRSENSSPIAEPDTANVTTESQGPTAGNVLSNDSDPNNDDLSVSMVEGLASNVGAAINGTYGTIRINQDGAFQYTLDDTNPEVRSLNAGETLQETFQYTVSDGVASATATLDLIIDGSNSPPIAESDTANVTTDSQGPTSGDVLSNDSDPNNDDLSVSTVEGLAGNVGAAINGSYGTIRINQDGNYEYTLDDTHPEVRSLNTGETLQETFQYTVSDGVASDTATLDLVISGSVPNRVVGDSNSDGVFNSADLILIFVAGEYEDGVQLNSSFETGDWNLDGEFDSSDLILAFQMGNYG